MVFFIMHRQLPRADVDKKGCISIIDKKHKVPNPKRYILTVTMATASITNLELTTTAIVNNLIKHKLANLDNIYNKLKKR